MTWLMEAMSDRPNVVWVTLDSVRFDHTSLSGYSRDTTPNLARVADGATGHSFTNCFAHSIWTLPSTASIMTGTPPSRHRLGYGASSLGTDLSTVAERFSDAGYETACLSRNTHLSSATNLDRGFDRFAWLAASTLLQEAGPVTTAKYLLNLQRHSAGFTLDTAKHATPFVMNDVAKRWLSDLKEGSDPFFCYLHYNEPHRPYYPPLPYLDRYVDDIDMSTREAAEFAMDLHYNLNEVVANGCNLSDERWAAVKAMYDAEIAYTDEMVGRLYDHLTEVVDDETVVVVTADHGELLGEHGMLAHKVSLHDAVLHVPMVVDGLGDVVDPDGLVQHADVMQTLLERAGGDTDQLGGVDVRSETREFVVAQRGPEEFGAFLDHNPAFDTSQYHADSVTCLRTDEFKYQRSTDATRLYQLPDETREVSDEFPTVADELDAELDAWLDAEGQPVESVADATFTDDMKEQLRDLGYVD